MKTPRRLTTALAAASIVAAGLVTAAAPAQASEEIYPAPASGSWTVDGRGYGHGRGLSQWGAQAAALQGKTADEILDFYYPSTTSRSIGGPYPWVDVTLTAYSGNTVTVWSPGGRQIQIQDANGVRTTHPAGRWTVTASDTSVNQITAERRDVIDGPVLETLVLVPDGSAGYNNVWFDSGDEVGMVIAGSQTATTGRWYRGTLLFEPPSRWASGLNVVNSVLMDDYLKSVVPQEAYASWKPAALQAQAVAARSYAWYLMANGSTLCDTTACQVYSGEGDVDVNGALTKSYEDPRTNAAIETTSGRARYFGDSVALTEFSSSNGGWTAAGSQPYQVAKADPWTGTAPGDTVTSWTATLSVARVAQSCPGTGGTLLNFVVVGRTGNGPLRGRITSARVECTTGNALISSPAFGLKSSWFKPRATTPVLDQIAPSATAIDNGAPLTIAATPNVGVTWTLTVKDRSTGRTAMTLTDTAAAGQRFNTTWLGDYAPRAADDPPYVGPGTYDVTLTAVDAAGTSVTPFVTSVQVRQPADRATVAAVPLVGDVGYVPLTPTRLLDTRDDFQSVGAAQRTDITVLGRAGVPASGVSAVALNVTAVGAVGDTHLRIWPAGLPMPNASSLNTDAAHTRASMVTVAVGGEGKISLYNAAGSTHYIVDVLGYYTTAVDTSSRYAPINPVRAFDSRSGAALMDGTTREIDVAGSLGIAPGTLTAATVNVTTTSAQGAGYVVAYGGGAMPATSTVNLSPGSDVANRTVVPVVNGKFSLTMKGGPAHVVVDVVGTFAPPGATSGSLFTPIQPSRLLDTRSGAPFGAAESSSLVVTGGAIPSGAVALAGTLTATNQTASATHARTWPGGQPLTPTSDLNSERGRTQANFVVVRISVGGSVMLYNNQGTSDLVFDAVGYYG